jgi:hypothetical protein
MKFILLLLICAMLFSCPPEETFEEEPDACSVE